LSHTAIVAREFALPAVVAAANATSNLVDGEEVTVDGTRGEVTRCSETTQRVADASGR
jgi:phosphohistidine swiveling domain-containing protein